MIMPAVRSRNSTLVAVPSNLVVWPPVTESILLALSVIPSALFRLETVGAAAELQCNLIIMAKLIISQTSAECRDMQVMLINNIYVNIDVYMYIHTFVSMQDVIPPNRRAHNNNE